MKSPMQLDVDDIIQLRNKYRKISEIKQWTQIWNASIPAGETPTNIDLHITDPGDDLFFIESVELLRDVIIQTLEYRGTSILGSRGDGTINQYLNGLNDPYMLLTFVHNKNLVLGIQENHGIDLDDEDILLFKGMRIELVSLDDKDESRKSNATVVNA